MRSVSHKLAVSIGLQDTGKIQSMKIYMETNGIFGNHHGNLEKTELDFDLSDLVPV